MRLEEQLERARGRNGHDIEDKIAIVKAMRKKGIDSLREDRRVVG